MKRLELSVLDLVPLIKGQTPREALEASVRLAQVAEEHGYKRFWVAEHHNNAAFLSTSPEILLTLLGSATNRIRIGSGGVMLPNHSPLRIAEQFLLLETLFPGRVDLGLGRAPGTDGRTAVALRRAGNTLDFGEQIEELLAFANQKDWTPHSIYRGVKAFPMGPFPPIYILGSSSYGAQLAGRMGFPYAFAHHFSELNPRLALQGYHDFFRPSKELNEPYAILGVSVIVGENAAQAERLALSAAALWHQVMAGKPDQLLPEDEAAIYLQAHDAQPAALLQKTIVGDAKTVLSRLQELADYTGAQELMISSHVGNSQAREMGLRLLAEANAAY